jgi:hypothetical protein
MSLRLRTISFFALMLIAGSPAASDYDATHCAAVTGTMHLHWQGVEGVEPCTGIEFTDGDPLDAADGSFTMKGVAVSDDTCIGIADYDFVLSADRTTLIGLDTANNVPMTLTRGSGQRCFVGRWTDSPFVYVATLAAVAAGEVFHSGLEAGEGLRPPRFNSTRTANFTVGSNGSFSVVASGVPVPGLSLASGTLPAAVTLTDNGNGTATLAGTPAAGSHTGSPYALALRASNGFGGDALQNFTLFVQCPGVTLSPVPGMLPTASYNASYSQAFMVNGVAASNVSLTAGALPPGLSLSGNTLSGTPSDAGRYAFTLQATAANGCTSAAQAYTLDVALAATGDAYLALGNVPVVSSTAGFSVVGNDSFPGGTTISAFDATTAGGGTVSMTTSGAGLGQFIYNPPRGKAAGVETFGYTLSRQGAGATAAVTASATVSFTHSGRIWFVNNAAGACSANCNGRMTHPYSSLAAFIAANTGLADNPGDNDPIFIHSGDSAYSGALELRPGQRLIGQGASSALATLAGVTVQSGQSLPSMTGLRPLLTGPGTTAVLLASDNHVYGIGIGTATTALGGVSFGTLRVGENVAIDTDGQGLVLSNGTLEGSFAHIRSSGGTRNVLLQQVATVGTAVLGGATDALSGASTVGLEIIGGGGSFIYAGSISNTNSLAVRVASKTGGTVTVPGSINPAVPGRGIEVGGNAVGGNTIVFSGSAKRIGGTSPGVALSNNAGATIAFTNGGLDISTSSTGFSATGGAGALIVSGSNNVIATTSGTALSVENTTIGAAGLTFRSISANGGARGIVLSSTGTSGGLTVTGSGSAGTGGTITNTQAGVVISDAAGVALNWMQFVNANTAEGGADSGGVSGGSCDAVTSSGCLGAVVLRNVAGASLDRLAISGTTVEQGVVATAVSNISITNSSIAGAGNARHEHAIRLVDVTGQSNLVNGNTVTGSGSANLAVANRVATSFSGTPDRIVISNNQFANPGHGHASSETASNVVVDARTGSGVSANLRVEITGNGFTNATATKAAINGVAAAADGAAKLQAIVTSNSIGNHQAPVAIASAGSANVRFDVSSNPLLGATSGSGVSITAADDGVASGRISGNPSISTAAANVSEGIRIVAELRGLALVDVTNNTVQGSWRDAALVIAQNTTGAGVARADVGFAGNTVDASGSPLSALIARTTGVSGASHVCLNFGSSLNRFSAPSSSLDVDLRQTTGTTFQLQGLTGSGTSAANVASWVSSRTTNAARVSASFGSVVNFTSATCQVPTLP